MISAAPEELADYTSHVAPVMFHLGILTDDQFQEFSYTSILISKMHETLCNKHYVGPTIFGFLIRKVLDSFDLFNIILIL